MASDAKSRSLRAADVLLQALDLAGTFLFGIEGGLAAIAGHLDVFGALVLSFCTALGGGIIRDLLIGAAPPGSIRDWRYGVVAFAGGGTAIFFSQFVQESPPLLLMTLDAAGLALFAVAGTTKALSYSIHPFIAILMGTITGVGGGTVRDLLLARVPTVLRADVYATAALLGAAVFVAGVKLNLSPRVAAMVGGAACFTLRMVAVARHWNLPALGAH
ncbi:MAG TPA: trimeric intracellular cation channel family protein [Bryobacteraceae bacterium]|nr:trimeric intracellular cation channel family protein [Bryobacteraceae bacterium]